ncbi:TlpA family protein disulfide reductase [Pseudoflavitalea sp. X16]|uniref:TlpA family protein disulfide reductase n=1 Tax=Paraflavitalea devenefica TaxID=2716334 RepID=UPI001420B81C|nr:TlpA disulfide reductase family protein [Paraflavitalea devenefica]NII26123.1 TlpA family protein disulfide reductase [Paraflavitalea devenefica]
MYKAILKALTILTLILSSAICTIGSHRPATPIYPQDAEIEIVLAAGVTFPKDSVILSLYEGAIFSGTYYDGGKPYLRGAKIVNGNCKIKVPMQQPIAYFSLMALPDSTRQDDFQDLLFAQLIETGDKIKINIAREDHPKMRKETFRFSFSGAGSQKLVCLRDMQLAAYQSQGDARVVLGDSVINDFNLYAIGRDNQLKVLEQYKPHLSENAYLLIKLDVQAFSNSQIYEMYRQQLKAARAETVRNRICSLHKKLKLADLPFSSEVKQWSKYYTDMISGGQVVSSLVASPDCKTPDFRQVYTRLFNDYKGTLRDKMLADFIIKYYPVIIDLDTLVRFAMKDMSEPAYSRAVAPYLHLKGGSPAFSFSLKDVKGQLRTLDEMKGKVVFIDFWFTGCTPCKALYEFQLKKVKAAFADNPAVVFVTISIDKNFELWVKSVDKGLYTDAHAINLYTNGEGRDHPIITHYGIKGYPATLLIDQVGNVVAAETTNDLKSAATITNYIKALLVKGQSQVNVNKKD